jgi:hypothetical protein
MISTKLNALAAEKSNPSVTISVITHKLHPDKEPDRLAVKNLISEAKSLLINKYQTEDISALLKNLEDVEAEVDIDFLNYSLNSLFIFISNQTKEIIRSKYLLPKSTIQIEGCFMLKPLFDDFLNSKEYYILLLSKSEANLFHAMNDEILEEIKNNDFPFKEDEQFENKYEKLKAPEKVDNLISESFNLIDKAITKLHQQTGVNCVVFSTADNYHKLLKVADIPSNYIAHILVNPKDKSPKTLVTEAWKIMKTLYQQETY